MGKNKSKSKLSIILLILIIAGSFFVYTSEIFERNKPTIELNNNGYWNLKKALNISITDESGVKLHKVTLVSANGKEILSYEQYIKPQQLLNIEVKPPRSIFSIKEKVIRLIVEVHDVSSWNFMKGNKTIKEFKFIIDKKRPQSSILSNSYKITRGGSALVIFKIQDENLEDIYIELNNKKKFKAQTFYGEGYYIALLAWPLKNKTFKATIVAKDYAGNISKTHIPLYIKQKKYKVSKIKISDNFLKGKIADLAEEFEETQGLTDSVEQFKMINENVRAKNEKLIHDLSSILPDTIVKGFNIKKMYPLKNGKVVASFGDHRKYLYKGREISESYHLGLDLASNAMASIKPQNFAKVVYSDYNGLYGNMPMLYHGLGLYTIYGHCSSTNVNVDDMVEAKMDIAKTGKSGYAMGDHLHFGVLVQGIEVRPEEWMDREWIKLNISDIIEDAKEIINKS